MVPAVVRGDHRDCARVTSTTGCPGWVVFAGVLTGAHRLGLLVVVVVERPLAQVDLMGEVDDTTRRLDGDADGHREAGERREQGPVPEGRDDAPRAPTRTRTPWRRRERP